MSMSLGGSGDSNAPMMDINTTPLIDVMLVMLVMLIITIPIMTHATKLDMPRDTNQPKPPIPPPVIDIEVDFDGTIVWNTQVVTMQQVEGFFRQASDEDPQPEIHLRPDRRARYGTVAQIMAAAQRNRMKKMGFTNVAQFSD
jgi:biopolymer transport protein ExbD